MKMSDVFALPVDENKLWNIMRDNYNIGELDKSAAHAINQHDALVDALENLLEACSSIRGIDMMMYIPGVITEVERILEREK